MKKGNLLFLVMSIVLIIIISIPMFQNTVAPAPVIFFGKMTTITSIYMPLVFLSMIDGALLVLYLLSLFKDLKRQDATKFDLK